MKNLLLMFALSILSIFSYGQTFMLQSIVAPNGQKTITIDEMLKAPQDFDLSTKDTEFLRRVKRGTVKIADEKDGREIVSCSIEDFFLHGGYVF